MKQSLSATSRITLSLVSMALTTLLGAHLLGLVPNERDAILRGRRQGDGVGAGGQCPGRCPGRHPTGLRTVGILPSHPVILPGTRDDPSGESRSARRRCGDTLRTWSKTTFRPEQWDLNSRKLRSRRATSNDSSFPSFPSVQNQIGRLFRTRFSGSVNRSVSPFAPRKCVLSRSERRHSWPVIV